MIRVLFISHYSGLGGANISLLHLISQLKEKVQPLVIIPKSGEIEQELKKRAIPYEVHRYASWRTKNRGFILNLAFSFAMIFLNLFQAVRFSVKFRNKIDLIHSNSSLVFIGALLKIFMRKPHVWHLREFGRNDYDLKFMLNKKSVNYFYSKADVLIAISESIEKYYKEKICPSANFILVYNGVDEKEIVYREPTNKGKTAICIVGGISESKNQIELIEAAKNITQYTTDFFIDIIGGGNHNYENYLKDVVKKSGLKDIIHFTGSTLAIGSILQNYEIGIVTSKNEAFGRVIIEYMLAGLAVVASNTGACLELITHGETGLLYNGGSSKDLSDKIRLLIENDSLKKKIVNNAYDLASNNFTAKMNATNIYQIYQQLL